MTILDLRSINLPDPSEHCRWASVLLRPVAGSPETLVIGVVAMNNKKAYFAKANALHRLDCLYSHAAVGTKLIVDICFSEIDEFIDHNELNFDIRHLSSGHIQIGEWRDGRGVSVEEVARRWLSGLSSLYDENQDELTLTAPIQEPVNRTASRRLKLRSDVLSAVARKKMSLADFFSEPIRRSQQHRREEGKISIDFSGSRLLANIEDAGGAQPWRTVATIKERLWDLKIARDSASPNGRREFEMLICSENPLVAPERKNSLLSELTRQADQVNLRLREFDSTEALALHIVKLEAA
ncbi:hypothetical protein FKB34_04800 [Glycocaulis profundi]|nr:hypothetical protein FKB34_04800 [Glycocaulis profundi]